MPNRLAPRRAALPGVTASVLDLIGNTPLVQLNALTDGLECRILVKLEGRNPGGSAKDRPALQLIRTAEASGALAPGGTIVESSSGNTGIGLALVGRLTGHPVVIVHARETSTEKLALLASYGAELVEANWDASPDDSENPRRIAERIAAERPGSWRSGQYDNPANPAAHYLHTGPEIWAQTGGAVTHLVASIGTGGTISGTGRYLKEASGGSVRVIGANPVGSTYGGGAAGVITVDGVGTSWPKSHWPGIFDFDLLDEVHTIPDDTVHATARRLATEEALLLGPSSGLAVATALDVARTADPDAVIVVVSADSGVNYLSKSLADRPRSSADRSAVADLASNAAKSGRDDDADAVDD